MSIHEIRMKIPEALWKRYKVVCVKRSLSVPKQTADLIRNFVESLEEEIKIKEKYGIY